MRTLSKKSKVVLSAATLVLFSLAEAQAGTPALQLQRLDNSAFRSPALSAQAVLHRLPISRSSFTIAKNRRAARNVIADAPITLLADRLHFAGTVSCAASSANGQPRRCSAFPRAPPVG